MDLPDGRRAAHVKVRFIDYMRFDSSGRKCFVEEKHQGENPIN